MNSQMPLKKYNCPYCGQVAEKPVDVDLKDRQRRIFESVVKAGPNGIDRKELLARMYADKEWPTPGGPVVLRVQINGLNHVLSDVGLRVVGNKSLGYRIVSTKDTINGKAAKKA